MADDDFIRRKFEEDTDLDGAGIYLWKIDGQSYVGKASRLRSRLNEYLNNVRKIETGQPYRKGYPNGFRAVHRHLAAAKAKGIVSEWRVLECCLKGEELLLRERHWISTLAPTLNGPRKGPGT